MKLLTNTQAPQIRAAAFNRPAGSVFVAFLCLAAQFGGALHLLLVPHSTCAQHGEAVHAEAIASDTSAASVAMQTSPSPALAQAAGGEGESDDHCTVAGLRRRMPFVVAHATVAIVPPLGCATIKHAAPQAVPAAIDLLLFAPKTSPPHRSLA